MSKRTLVIGASEKQDRYSNRAIWMLKEAGHDVIAVGNKAGETHGIPIYKSQEFDWTTLGEVDTVTLYVSEKYQDDYKEIIQQLQPKRVIFNPGTENDDWYKALQQEAMNPESACTLVLLSTGQY